MTGSRISRSVWFAATAAIAAILFVRMQAAVRSFPDRRFVIRGSVASGELLLHRVMPERGERGAVSFYMPLFNLSAAVLFTHNGGILNPKRAIGLLLLAIGALLLALTYSLTAPVVFALFFPVDQHAFGYKEAVFSFLVLLTAGVLLWRARKPSARKSAVLGLAVGATLLFRSSLAFFPPFLALYEWLFLYRRSLRLYWKQLVCLCVLPYLFLIPWLHMNWALHGRIIPFEYHGADTNIIAGTLGLVQTIEGPTGALVNDRNFGGGQSRLFSWALREIDRHPWRYAAGYLERLAYVASLNPILLLLALTALWLDRKKEEFRQLGLLGLYFVGVHCLMSVQEDYFAPLWPLASILVVSLIERFRPRRGLSIAPRLYRISRIFVGASLGVVLTLCLWTDAIVSSYAFRAASDPSPSKSDLDDAVRFYPDDAWPLFERGEQRLERGELHGAVADLSEGLVLAGPNVDHADPELRLAWAKMLLGDSGPLFQWRPPADAPPRSYTWLSAHIFKANGYSRLGQTKKSRQELAAAMDSYKSGIFARGSSVLEMETIAELRRDPLVEKGVLQKINFLLASRPAQERQGLARELPEARELTSP